MVESHRITLDVILLNETGPAIEVRVAGTRRTSWLPKQLVVVENETSDGSATIRLTHALATAKGLV